MAWSYKIDGNEINDNVQFHVTGLPELDDEPDDEVILAKLAGDHPVFIRTQPVDTVYTLLIAMMPPVSNATYQTRLALLKSWFTAGVPHTLTVEARGMDEPKSVVVIRRGITVNFKLRLVAIQLVVPKPVLV